MKQKKIGFWILSSLVVGNMVGSGIFLLPASLAAIGSITMYSWGYTAIGAILLALVFGKLGQLFPKTGGPYVYSRNVFGNFIGFQVAYSYWIYLWIGNAAKAVACTGYLSAFFPALGTNPWLAFVVTTGIVWLVTLLNAISVRTGGIASLITSVIKLLPLLLMIAVGFFYADASHWSAFNLTGNSNFTAISHGAILTLWAFTGLESACIPADDVEDPKKNIPRATILGTLVTAVIYILSMAALIGVIAPEALAKSNFPFGDAAGILFGPWGKAFVSAGAVVACLGTLNGCVLLQGQVPYAAAKDKLFPKPFQRKSKSGVPLFGLLFSSCLITLLLTLSFNQSLVDRFTLIVSLATLAALVAYLYSAVAQLILGKWKKAIGSMAIALGAAAYSFWAIFGSGEVNVFYGTILLFSSIPLYALAMGRRTPRA